MVEAAVTDARDEARGHKGSPVLARFAQPQWAGLIVTLLYLCSGAIYIIFFGFDLSHYDEFTYAAMAADFARLFVPEPFFYGQDYGFPVDAWLAAPLVAAHLSDALTAVKITAYGLFVVPFALAGFIAYRRNQPIIAFVIWLLPFLSMMFFVIAPMPRGFNQGAALAALVGILFVSRPKAGLAERLCYSVCFALTFAINPSAAIVIAPVLALALTDAQHYPMRSAVIRIGATWAVFLILCELLSTWRDAFFRQHSNFAYHKLGYSSLVDMITPIDYSSYIFKLHNLSLSLWDGYRPHMVGILALTVFAIVKLVKRDWQWLSVAIGGVALIGALMLSALNAHAGSDRFTSLYGQHAARVFTGVPYVLALLLLLVPAMPPPGIVRRHVVWLAGGVFCVAIGLTVAHVKWLARSYNASRPNGMGASGLRETLKWCDRLAAMTPPATTLVVTYSPEIAYLCEAISKAGLRTLYVYERRNYRLQQAADGQFNTLLVKGIPELCGNGPDDLCSIGVAGIGDLNRWLIAHGVPIREGRTELLPTSKQ
jgi:hypothetical protein